jgi:DNA-binding NarL/FixJ family response regulator
MDEVEIADRLYEAALLPELWPEALARLAEYTDTGGAAVLSINERGVRIVTSPSLRDVGEQVIREGWMDRSGRAEGVVRRGLVGAPRFLTEVDYFDAGQVETDPIVNEVFKPAGFGWAAGFLNMLPHDDLVLVNVEQYWNRGPIEGDTLDRLNQLYPVCARASSLAARNDYVKVRSAIETLGTIGLPAVALTRTGRVEFANDLFSSAEHVWTTRAGERIALIDAAADRQLAEALQGGALLSLPLRRGEDREIFGVLQLTPIRRSAHDIFGRSSHIAVLSEARTQTLNGRLVQSLFDLTPTELQVASAIAAGQTVAEIAQKSGRSWRTVRNQLNSVLAKTGCSRQADLIIIMRQLADVRG